MRFARFALSLPLLFAALPARVASAQSVPSIDARTWRPSSDPSAGLVLEPTTTPGAWSWNVGALASYAYRPVSVASGGTAASASTTLRPVESLLGLDVVAGLGLGHHLSLGLDLPTAIFQTGTKNLPPAVVSGGQVPSSALGDLALTAKASLIDNAQGGFGLAALANVTAPTGDAKSFIGEGSATVGLRIVADYTLLVASVQASLGYLLRVDQRTWPSGPGGGSSYGDAIPWSVAIALKPDIFKIDKGHRQRWELGFHGWLPAGPVAPFVGTGAAQLSPAIVSLADRIEIGHYRDSYILVGAEAGMTDAVGSPLVRGILGIGWAPRNHDLDADGVPDDVDQCPELPEDRDNFEDRDGCPEIDNDDDGVLDKDDACPNVAGVASSDPKKNGCPQPDRDKDGVPDGDDACPDAKGLESDDPKANGCPMSSSRDKKGASGASGRCPDHPESQDSLADENGCLPPDSDGDGVADAQDACPKEPGQASTDATLNGCPNPDRDGDTYDNAADKCPDEAETFNGVKDDDGCADTSDPSAKGAKPLVVAALDGPEHAPRLKVAARDKLALEGTTVRAIVTEANRHRDWTFLVANHAAKSDVALARAAELADRLDKLAHRELAEAVAWDAVKSEATTTGDTKIVIVVGGGGTKVPPLAPLPPAQAPKP